MSVGWPLWGRYREWGEGKRREEREEKEKREGKEKEGGREEEKGTACRDHPPTQERQVLPRATAMHNPLRQRLPHHSFPNGWEQKEKGTMGHHHLIQTGQRTAGQGVEVDSSRSAEP